VTTTCHIHPTAPATHTADMPTQSKQPDGRYREDVPLCPACADRIEGIGFEVTTRLDRDTMNDDQGPADEQGPPPFRSDLRAALARDTPAFAPQARSGSRFGTQLRAALARTHDGPRKRVDPDGPGEAS